MVHRHRCTQEQRRIELASILEPAYQHPSSPSPSSSSSPLRGIYTDCLGNVHDAAYTVFPTEEWKAVRRRSLEEQRERRRNEVRWADSDDEEEEDEKAYAFGGSKTRVRYSSRNTAATRTVKTTPTKVPTYASYTSTFVDPSPSMFPYPTFSLSSSPDAEQQQHKSPLSRISRKLRSLTKRSSHEMYEEDAGWEGYPDDDDDPHPTPSSSSPSSSLDSPLTPTSFFDHSDEDSDPNPTIIPDQEEDLFTTPSSSSPPTCAIPQALSSIKLSTRRKWQYLQLSIQFAIFRTERRWKRRLSF